MATAATGVTIYSLCYYDFSCRITVSQDIALAKRFSSCIVKQHTPLQLVVAVSDFQRINLSHLNEKKREEMTHSLSPAPEKSIF